jgi:hypothetical protein
MHNRVTELLFGPLQHRREQNLFGGKGVRLNDDDLARTYMAFSGIPFYLKNLRPGDGFVTAIERSCFQSSGRMTREYVFLYDALFKDAELHKSIVATLASFPNGLRRQRLLKEGNLTPNGSFNRAVNELRGCRKINYPSESRDLNEFHIYSIKPRITYFSAGP